MEIPKEQIRNPNVEIRNKPEIRRRKNSTTKGTASSVPGPVGRKSRVSDNRAACYWWADDSCWANNSQYEGGGGNIDSPGRDRIGSIFARELDQVKRSVMWGYRRME
jgi:hypothetical protein